MKAEPVLVVATAALSVAQEASNSILRRDRQSFAQTDRSFAQTDGPRDRRVCARRGARAQSVTSVLRNETRALISESLYSDSSDSPIVPSPIVR